MITIAFDCSTEFIEIYLDNNGKSVLNKIDTNLKHSELLLTEIIEVLKSENLSLKDLDLIICAKGPGSFTGLRIAMSTAKGLSVGLDIPVISVSNLDEYLFESKNSEYVFVPVIDGKKNRFYSRFYENGIAISDFLDKSVEDLEKLFLNDKNYFITGPDANLFFEQLSNKQNCILDKNYQNSKIENLVKVGLGLFNEGKFDTLQTGPIYIRKSQAEE